MRTLLLLRGSPGCGKSTWIHSNGLAQYTLSADNIRLMFSSPELNINGKYSISQKYDRSVWDSLFYLLEYRMQNGEFTVIDATNSKTREMKRYRELCEKYKYRVFCVDFTSIPIEVTKERNANREELKRVPDDVIDKMYSRFDTQKIPSGITVISPDELDKVWIKKRDLSSYKAVHHIGDVHGCNTALQEYLKLNGGIQDDEFYIFCGDYIDRGIENAEVLQFLLSIYEKPNVYLLEGNHERWLRDWSHDTVCKSKEFECYTRAQLEKAGIRKSDIARMYRRMGQCAYYQYDGATYLVTHAGLSTVPENLTLVSTDQMIRGVGTYGEAEEVADSFEKNTNGFYQIHGHRNAKHLPIDVNDHVFNLEGQVEFGGKLRCVKVQHDGTRAFEIQNKVFNKDRLREVSSAKEAKEISTVADAIVAMRENKYIQEKQFGNISSFNFTKSAFYEKVWNSQTTKARGLYINIPKQKVVARAYNKFFNINEREETKLDALQHTMTFPATAYVKENGFLGIVSYNEETDSLFVTTKSNPEGEFSVWLSDMLHKSLSSEKLEELRKYSRDHNVSFVFECVDMEHDPHIIEYPESSLYLLDLVYNDMQYRKCDFQVVCSVADQLGLKHKELAYRFDSWSDFYDFYYEALQEGFLYHGRNIEGFVIEDASGNMVKMKLQYYNFWKFMRSVSHEAIKNGYINGKRTAALTTPLSNHYYGWVRTLHDVEDQESIPKDICSLRRMFYKTEIGSRYAG